MMPFLEVVDTLTSNNKEPGLSNKHRWLPAEQRTMDRSPRSGEVPSRGRS